MAANDATAMSIRVQPLSAAHAYPVCAGRGVLARCSR